MRLEHYVMQAMADGRSVRQIARDLGIHADTIRRHLRARGYRINQHSQLVTIAPPGQGGAGRRAGR